MRRDVAGVGAALVLAGVAVSLFPGLVPGVAQFVTPRVVTALAVLAALVGIAAIVRSAAGSGDTEDSTEASAAGAGAELPTVGEAFEAALADVERMSAVRLRTSDGPAYLREQLRQAAVVTVARERGLDHDEAAGHVDDGTWTDDPVAAAFLSPTLEAPWRVRLREVISTTPRAVARARRTAAELEGRL